ncbi:MAG: hypothetical protein KAI97_02230, partial [Gemmatimonadetes bacterium]|nr:hypothetical protein [Gemmatimonadota bacterium]
ISMPNRHVRLKLFVISSLLLGALTAPSVLAKDTFKAKFRGDLFFDYTDNLFRLDDVELDEFDNFQDPGERFYNMETPEDVIVRLRLRGDLSWRLAKKRKLRLALLGSYIGHASNSISDFPRFAATLSGDITKRDQLYGGVEVIYDRFWKNLRVGDTDIFAPAIYSQVDLRIGYVREIKKRWNVAIEYLHRIREYDPPLEVRDRDGDYLTGSTAYRLAKKVAGETVVDVGNVVTGTQVVFPGILIDRSYVQAVIEQNFSFKLSGRSVLDLGVQYRQRRFTTDEQADTARYDRVDPRWRVGAVWGYEVTKSLTLELRARHTNADSDRVDPTANVDQLGYTESRFGFGIRLKF